MLAWAVPFFLKASPRRFFTVWFFTIETLCFNGGTVHILVELKFSIFSNQYIGFFLGKKFVSPRKNFSQKYSGPFFFAFFTVHFESQDKNTREYSCNIFFIFGSRLATGSSGREQYTEQMTLTTGHSWSYPIFLVIQLGPETAANI